MKPKQLNLDFSPCASSPADDRMYKAHTLRALMKGMEELYCYIADAIRDKVDIGDNREFTLYANPTDDTCIDLKGSVWYQQGQWEQTNAYVGIEELTFEYYDEDTNEYTDISHYIDGEMLIKQIEGALSVF